MNEGKVKKAFAILSDKRLYLRGKRYEIAGKGSSNPDRRGKAVRTEKIVDIKDVKTVEVGRVGRVLSFLYLYSAIIATALSIIALVLTIIAINLDGFQDSEGKRVLTISIMAALGFGAVASALWISFVSSLKSCISLLCNDTWIRFPLKKYVDREGYALMRHIIILQMPYREKVSAPNSNYNDSIFAQDGKLTVKSQKIKPKEPIGEKTVDLKDITDIKIFRRSRSLPVTIIVYLCVILVNLWVMLGLGEFVPILLWCSGFILIYMCTPSKWYGLKVTCPHNWFLFLARNRQEGTEIMRYIVEQQVYHEQNSTSR